MALEDLTGPNKFITNLVVTNPLASDDRREGDDHIRGVKNVLANTFPNFGEALELTPEEITEGVSKASGAVQKAGDTMTGPLLLPAGAVGEPALAFADEPGLGLWRDAAGTIKVAVSGVEKIRFTGGAAAASSVGLTAPAGQGNFWSGFKPGGVRWNVTLGDGTAEGGANAGSDYGVYRYSDAGALIEQAMGINRATGVSTFARSVAVTLGNVSLSNGSFYFNAGTTAFGVVSNNWYDYGGGYRGANMLSANSLGDSLHQQAIHNPGVSVRWRWLVAGSNFDMHGSGRGESSQGWFAVSDRRVKANCRPIEDALAKLAQLEGCTFDRLDVHELDGSTITAAGLIAQEVRAVLPEAVAISEGPPDELIPDGKRLSLDPFGPIALLVQAVNELQARVAHLEALQVGAG